MMEKQSVAFPGLDEEQEEALLTSANFEQIAPRIEDALNQKASEDSSSKTGTPANSGTQSVTEQILRERGYSEDEIAAALLAF